VAVRRPIASTRSATESPRSTACCPALMRTGATVASQARTGCHRAAAAPRRGPAVVSARVPARSRTAPAATTGRSGRASGSAAPAPRSPSSAAWSRSAWTSSDSLVPGAGGSSRPVSAPRRAAPRSSSCRATRHSESATSPRQAATAVTARAANASPHAASTHQGAATMPRRTLQAARPSRSAVAPRATAAQPAPARQRRGRESRPSAARVARAVIPRTRWRRRTGSLPCAAPLRASPAGHDGLRGPPSRHPDRSGRSSTPRAARR